MSHWRRMAEGEANPPLAEINVVPLIDVMLVLLAILIVTAPLITHAVKVDLPQASSAANPPPPHHVQLAIGAAGELAWDAERIDRAALAARLAELARRAPDAELRIHADRATPYATVAWAMALAARQGLSRIGFVSLPESHTD